MRFMRSERATLDTLLPGLDASLARFPLDVLERAPSPAIAAFRAAGGTGLVVPKEYGGLGATPLEAVRVQRALGARCPSLAVATTMHHLSVAPLARVHPDKGGPERELLTSVARDRLLVASGFAEGSAGQHILRPHITARRRPGGRVVLDGSKKPCSLARSMDLLAASVTLPGDDGRARLAIAVVPAGAPGVEVRPFWRTPVLAGAESEEVVLRNVAVDPGMLFITEVTEEAVPDRLNIDGFLWFELLVTASYLGVAGALAERVVTAPGGGQDDPAAFTLGLDSAMLAVEAVAYAMEATEWTEGLLASALAARYAAQDVIARTASACLSALGGMAFIGSPEGSYLASAVAGLAFHPPARARMTDPLRDYLHGSRLRIG
ncbi:acyl-CoA dehydrogenase family protein [Streptomyces marincola]|uniref:Isobutylamine N-hydroxylase n=1 Tax=Streptomyces marincola TaxID=2878388 RepID=A0A1W7CVQ5_9ACTN|nr:acyl-CoA dehydrogenase family protein [Streptomyces marincola]ARQ68817.1 isobutylamine N-hydroxylase [Streptomyces marincola]